MVWEDHASAAFGFAMQQLGFVGFIVSRRPVRMQASVEKFRKRTISPGTCP